MSRRFGGDKRFHPIDGTPMLARTAARYVEAFADVLVVVAPGDDDAATLVRPLGCAVVVAEDAREGMGRSLAAGIAAAPGHAHAFVALADMPFIEAATLRRLRGLVGPGRIVRPMFRGRPGHPVGFAEDHFEALSRLRGDEGAREVVAANPRALVTLWTDDTGVTRDIDEPPAAASAPREPLAT